MAAKNRLLLWPIRWRVHGRCVRISDLRTTLPLPIAEEA
jgi:hypothetical protein